MGSQESDAIRQNEWRFLLTTERTHRCKKDFPVLCASV